MNAEVAEKRISMWVGFVNYKYRLLEYSYWCKTQESSVSLEDPQANLPSAQSSKSLVRWCSWLSRLSNIHKVLDTRGPRIEPGPNHQFSFWIFPSPFTPGVKTLKKEMKRNHHALYLFFGSRNRVIIRMATHILASPNKPTKSVSRINKTPCQTPFTVSLT